MAIDMSGDMVGNILRSGGNSFRVSRMGTPPSRQDAQAASSSAETGRQPERVEEPVQLSEGRVGHLVANVSDGSGQAATKGPRRRLSTSVTVDSSDVAWLKEERIRRRVEGEDGPYSFSGILKQALSASLGVADAGGGIDDCSKVASGDDLVRMTMSMDLDTWLRVNETIERFRSEGVSPTSTRLSCFVRKGLDLIR